MGLSDFPLSTIHFGYPHFRKPPNIYNLVDKPHELDISRYKTSWNWSYLHQLGYHKAVFFPWKNPRIFHNFPRFSHGFHIERGHHHRHRRVEFRLLGRSTQRRPRPGRPARRAPSRARPEKITGRGRAPKVALWYKKPWKITHFRGELTINIYKWTICSIAMLNDVKTFGGFRT